jgi:lipopolysaccharide transport system ATP-binding protein
MDDRRIIVEDVWKKYRRGQRHDSLRDLIPYSVQRVFRRAKPDELGKQEFWVLRQLSFDVRAGEAVGIIGVNGAGKSTTLKLLTRILRPTRGRLEVRGRVGALIELAAGFHPDLTGRENVFLQGAVMGLSRSYVAKRFDEIVEFSGVADFIDTQVKRYSSGMNARLGFSIAAFLDPDVLLIDEVLAVGDLSFQQKCFARLADFRRQGIAIAFVSHNMQAVASLCDRAILLRPRAEPLQGGIADVISAYATADRGSIDPRVELLSCQLTANGEPLSGTVEPSSRLALSIVLRTRASLPRAGVSLIVRRADGLLVFNGNSLAPGARATDLPPGELVSIHIDFFAHLLRGTFLVSCVILDEQRLWEHVELGMLASFVVDERGRWGGVAELNPTFDVSVTIPAAT